jgi:hypothetical protein
MRPPCLSRFTKLCPVVPCTIAANGGKENVMKLSLATLLKCFGGRGAGRCSSRPRARLQVEQLEERAVPAVYLPNYYFNFPGVGSFHATSEPAVSPYNVVSQFSGTFFDAKSGISISVSCKILGFGSVPFNFMSFQGGAGKGLEFESVRFLGILNEGQQLDIIIPPTMQGSLTEDYTWLTSVNPQNDPHQTVSTFVTGIGQLGSSLPGPGHLVDPHLMLQCQTPQAALPKSLAMASQILSGAVWADGLQPPEPILPSNPVHAVFSGAAGLHPPQPFFPPEPIHAVFSGAVALLPPGPVQPPEPTHAGFSGADGLHPPQPIFPPEPFHAVFSEGAGLWPPVPVGMTTLGMSSPGEVFLFASAAPAR